jgi:hypothetical protein
MLQAMGKTKSSTTGLNTMARGTAGTRRVKSQGRRSVCVGELGIKGIKGMRYTCSHGDRRSHVCVCVCVILFGDHTWLGLFGGMLSHRASRI